jgi:hypothetical protein
MVKLDCTLCSWCGSTQETWCTTSLFVELRDFLGLDQKFCDNFPRDDFEGYFQGNGNALTGIAGVPSHAFTDGTV